MGVWLSCNTIDGIRVYLDGLDYKGGVRATAILYNSGKLRVPTAKVYLGKLTEHTVFEVEIIALWSYLSDE